MRWQPSSKSIKENDVVELREAFNGWPAGTIGAVVSERGEAKLIEIADEQGQMLDMVSISEPQLKLIAKHSD